MQALATSERRFGSTTVLNWIDGSLKVTGAAIANAVYHATDIRVHDLSITLDKLVR